MRHRCRNTKNPFYPKYGGRGITVVDEWYDSFAAFLADMGKRPGLEYSLDRIDGTKGYSKDNCRWATRSEQASNTIRTKPHNAPSRGPITYKGETLSRKEWAARQGISDTSLAHRLYTYGWTLDEALGGKPRTVDRGYPRKYFLEWNGETRHVSEWAEQAGISSDCLLGRIFRLGWTMDRAMTEPKGQYHRKAQPEK